MAGKVCVMGSGIIGRCWSILFSRAGYSVILYDISPEQIKAALLSIKEQLGGLKSGGKSFFE